MTVKPLVIIKRCESCGHAPLEWDADGSLSGLGYPCWYCPECFWATTKYPPPG